MIVNWSVKSSLRRFTPCIANSSHASNGERIAGPDSLLPSTPTLNDEGFIRISLGFASGSIMAVVWLNKVLRSADAPRLYFRLSVMFTCTR